ncbi:hypothetical protein D9M68_620990 [compost metagenome]
MREVLLARPQRDGRAACERRNEFVGLRLQLRRRYRPAHQAARLCFAAGPLSTAEDEVAQGLEGDAVAQCGHHQRRRDVALHLWNLETAVIGGQRDVAHRRERGADAGRAALHDGQRGHRCGLDGVVEIEGGLGHELPQPFRRRRRRALGRRGRDAPGAEVGAGATQADDAHLGVQARQRADHGRAHRGAHQVAVVRRVERDVQDRPVAPHDHHVLRGVGLVIHGWRAPGVESAATVRVPWRAWESLLACAPTAHRPGR